MSANEFGHLFKITTFGESHGPAMGVVIDGCPAGVEFNFEILHALLQRRRPGFSNFVSARVEEDTPEILSGVFAGRTLGTPITIITRNQDARSADYKDISQNLDNKINLRSGHADDVWREKFTHSDARGGGRASGRETWSRVAAGAVAQMFLRREFPELTVRAFPVQIGPHKISAPNEFSQFGYELPTSIQEFLTHAREAGESYGGVVQVVIRGAPAGLGQPVFHKLKSDLASAMLTIGATMGVELGEGFSVAAMKGSTFHNETNGKNNYAGVRGGISTGEEITLQVAFKPTSSIHEVAKKGRHDPCIVPRAAVVCEAMASLVLADHALWRRLDK